ncbi:hypothetical protein C0J52_12524 [Blattella germanica]|nr:hypothetical protein C0J52_12524 [Blattella germanica]
MSLNIDSPILTIRGHRLFFEVSTEVSGSWRLLLERDNGRRRNVLEINVCKAHLSFEETNKHFRNLNEIRTAYNDKVLINKKKKETMCEVDVLIG